LAFLLIGGFVLRDSLACVNSGVEPSSTDEEKGGVYSQKISALLVECIRLVCSDLLQAKEGGMNDGRGQKTIAHP
jgi:hypothetical protein